ncbi:MAG: response regulator [Nitrospira sp.]|nr:MAG: response regulator [Nitrospira sp.]
MASHVFETVHRHKDGHTMAVEVSLQLVREEQGGEGRFIAVVRDITERRQAEEEIKVRSIWQKAVLDYAGYAIIATTPDGVIQTFNRAAERMLGYRAEEVIGKMSPAVIHDPQEVEDRAKTFSMELGERIEPGFEVFVAKALKNLPNEHEWTYIRKDGTRFPVLLSVTALRSSGEGITGFLGLALDITERKQSESALRAYTQELELINQSLDLALNQAEAATAAKSAFLSTMSHEIRTPLNGVIGMTGLLLDTDLTSEQREFAETVRSSGNHLLTVINDILDFSKIEAGKMSLEIIDFDLRTAVDESVDLLAEQAAGKGLNLACLFHADVPAALRGDPGRLRQILLNLLVNAIKFTEQGDVVLSVTLLHHTETEATVRFEVQDTGIGLSPDAQEHLFQSFTQADSSTTRKFGGTGLGLAICKQLTKLMGGQIGVDSKLGEGSTFWLTVQLGKQPEATASVAAMASQDLQGLLLCIVDDSPINRRILETYATQWGAQCLIAEDGRQALAVLRKVAAEGYACDFAIINMQLPGLDGLELARAIKADPMLAPTRLVLLTHQGQRGDAQAAHTAGYAAYLRRPVRESQLYECLVTLCALSAPATAREGQSAGRTVRPALVTRHSLAEAKAQATAKILVAEDNVVNQKVAVRMLEKLGYRVDLVANGLEALEAVSRISYDAVLMDCQMPEMDGLTATAEIRRREASRCISSSTFHVSGSERDGSVRQPETCNLKLETRRRIPIIAMTANALQVDRDLCFTAGMDDFLSKPVQPKLLAEVLARWVSAPVSTSNSRDDRPLRTVSEGRAA